MSCEDQCDSLPGVPQVEEKGEGLHEGRAKLGSSQAADAQSLTPPEGHPSAQLEATSSLPSSFTADLPPPVSRPLLNTVDCKAGSVPAGPLPPPLPPTSLFQTSIQYCSPDFKRAELRSVSPHPSSGKLSQNTRTTKCRDKPYLWWYKIYDTHKYSTYREKRHANSQHLKVGPKCLLRRKQIYL